MSRIIDTADTYIANTYIRSPVALTSGKGAVVYDDEGKRYVDLGAGIAVNTFGYADGEWQSALIRQMSRLQHTSNLYYTEPCAALAERLCGRTGMKKVFFGNSGAEANECAIKAARKWAFDRRGDESHATVITLKNSFHGRTLATLSATGQDNFHTMFGPFPPGFVYADPEDASDVERLASENNCCAVMLELVQGEGGVRALDREFVDGVLETAKRHGLLVVVDEVQTGNGRTGELFAYTHYGFQPDILTTAKGLAGGLPLGACLLGEKVKDTLGAGDHGSTFGGNPICCAGAISILDRLTDELLAEVREKAAFVRSALDGAPGVRAVTGLGLMVGIEAEKPAGDVIAACLDRGALVLSAHGRIRLLPPLNIGMDELSEGIDILKEVLSA